MFQGDMDDSPLDVAIKEEDLCEENGEEDGAMASGGSTVVDADDSVNAPSISGLLQKAPKGNIRYIYTCSYMKIVISDWIFNIFMPTFEVVHIRYL